MDILFNVFSTNMFSLDNYDTANLEHETLVLMVASTFGNGDPPENGKDFKSFLCKALKQKTKSLKNVRFSVFGLGNSSYPLFGQFGKFLDETLVHLGADRVSDLVVGDDLNGQEETFRLWSIDVYRSALKMFSIEMSSSVFASITKDDSAWCATNYRIVADETNESLNLCTSLSRLHKRKILPCTFLSKRNLSPKSDSRAICVSLSTQEFQDDFEYQPGDHIGLFAENRKELIDKILPRLSDTPEPDQLIQIETLKGKLRKHW